MQVGRGGRTKTVTNQTFVIGLSLRLLIFKRCAGERKGDFSCHAPFRSSER